MQTRRKGSSPTGDLMTQRVLAPKQAMPVGPGFWHWGQGAREARQAPSTSLKAWGKAPAMEVVLPPPEMDEELAQQLQ